MSLNLKINYLFWLLIPLVTLLLWCLLLLFLWFGLLLLRLGLMLWLPALKISAKGLNVAIIHFWPHGRRLGVKIQGLTDPSVRSALLEVVFYLLAVVGQRMWHVIHLELVLSAKVYATLARAKGLDVALE